MLGTGKRSSETKCGILLPLFLIWLIKIPDQVYTCFQTRTAQKTLLFGAAHTHMAYIRKYPPPPRLPRTNFIPWNLESVSYFGTREHFSGKKKRRILRTKTSIVRLVCCRKLSLYANESCDEHAYYFFRRWLRCRTMFITFWSLEIMSRPLIFVYLYHTC